MFKIFYSFCVISVEPLSEARFMNEITNIAALEKFKDD